MQTSVRTDTLQRALLPLTLSPPEGNPAKAGTQSFRSNGFKEPMTAGLPAKAFAFVVTDFLS